MGAVEEELRRKVKREQDLKSRYKGQRDRFKAELNRLLAENEVLTARLQGRKPRTAAVAKGNIRLETTKDIRDALVANINDLRLEKAIAFDGKNTTSQQRASLLEKEAKMLLDVLKLTKPDVPPKVPVVVAPDRMEDWDEFCEVHNVRMQSKEPIPIRCPNCNGAGVLRRKVS